MEYCAWCGDEIKEDGVSNRVVWNNDKVVCLECDTHEATEEDRN